MNPWEQAPSALSGRLGNDLFPSLQPCPGLFLFPAGDDPGGRKGENLGDSQFSRFLKEPFEFGGFQEGHAQDDPKGGLPPGRSRFGRQSQDDLPREYPGNGSPVFFSFAIEKDDGVPFPQAEDPADVANLPRVIDESPKSLDFFPMDPETANLHSCMTCFGLFMAK
jgi:hypothetical protein